MAARAPAGLGTKAKKIWNDTTKVYDLRADELRILEDACREIDLVERIEEQLNKPGSELVVRGSMGQPVASPLIQEIRQHRAMVKTLLTSLKLPDEDDTPSAAGNRSTSARAAAEARWRRGA